MVDVDEMYTLDDITIAIKAFQRPDKLNNCLKSIRKFYPNIRIIVADDSRKSSSNTLADEYYMLEHDTGISFGRNYLVNKVKTPLMMIVDDDTIFTQGDCIENMLRPMLDHSEINLVAGTLTNNDYYGNYEKYKDILFRKFKTYHKEISGYRIYDFVINLFLAKTESLRVVKWDDDLKICEHTNFFFRGMSELTCTIAKNTTFINDNKANSRSYMSFRHGRSQKYIDKQFKSLGVTIFKDIVKDRCDS